MLCPPKETHKFKHAAVVRDRGHDQVPAYGGVLRLEKLRLQYKTKGKDGLELHGSSGSSPVWVERLGVS